MPLDRSPTAEELLKQRGPLIDIDSKQAYHSPHSDKIYLPTLDQFDSIEAYYSVAFHELATGWEELVAEMGAASFAIRPPWTHPRPCRTRPPILVPS